MNMRAVKRGTNTVNMVSNKDISQNLYMSSITFKFRYFAFDQFAKTDFTKVF